MVEGQVTIERGAVVCQKSQIEGDVVIDTVVHMEARIIARNGPIIIGSNNIICEGCTIVNSFREPLIIGDDNEFESYSYIENRGIGHCNVIHPRGRAVGDTTIGSNCVIGPGCSTDPSGETPIADGTVIYGADEMIRVRNKIDTAGYLQLHQKHLKYLVETLPKYNHILET